MTLQFLDTTLRDGAQAPGVSFSVEDKLSLIRLLDAFGLDVIEAGSPAANPKDKKLFDCLRGETLSAKLCAFCTTVRPGAPAQDDPALCATLAAETPVVSVVGKAQKSQVVHILNTAPEENLRMVRDTVAFFAAQNRQVIFDAEHFFDGAKEDSDYALAVLSAAADAGAATLCLCDTNGAALPEEVGAVLQRVGEHFLPETLAVHFHNDLGLAVANTLAAVRAGVCGLQVTQLGIGERCGNADFQTLLPILIKYYGADCRAAKNLSRLTPLAREVCEICNFSPDESHPFVGRNAFTHKGGLHVDGVSKKARSFENIAPEEVGNERHTVVSEQAGKSALLARVRELAPDTEKNSPVLQTILEKIKSLEFGGYYYENADASLYLLIQDALGCRKKFFELLDFKLVLSDAGRGEQRGCSGMMKIAVGSETEIAAAEGNGPVDAMDKVLRKALCRFYPSLAKMHLSDYKVRVLNSEAATGAAVRVLIQSSYQKERFGTVGVSTDITEASFSALCDAVEYFLTRLAPEGKAL